MNTLIANDHIKLVCTTKQDLPFVIEAENASENAQFVTQWTREEHLDTLHDPDMLHLLVKNEHDETVGYVIIKGLIHQQDNIELARIVVTAKGFGYGKSVLSLVKKWSFEVHGAHRLWLDVVEDNSRARHVYQSQGFVYEGMLRESIKTGDCYESLILMSILAREYEAHK